MYTITGEPSEEALSQLIESLLNFIIENQLCEDVAERSGDGDTALG